MPAQKSIQDTNTRVSMPSKPGLIRLVGLRLSVRKFIDKFRHTNSFYSSFRHHSLARALYILRQSGRRRWIVSWLLPHEHKRIGLKDYQLDGLSPPYTIPQRIVEASRSQKSSISLVKFDFVDCCWDIFVYCFAWQRKYIDTALAASRVTGFFVVLIYSATRPSSIFAFVWQALGR